LKVKGERLERVFIYGAGGAGRELAMSLMEMESNYIVEGFIDDNYDPGLVINGVEVKGGFDWIMQNGGNVIMCVVGNPHKKESIVERLKANPDIKFPVVIAPGSVISKYIEWGEGCLVSLPFNHITVNIKIGRFVHINSDNMIGHDVEVGDFTTIYSSINIGGGVKIGSHCVIGSGTVINPDIKIGNDVIVGAGSVVIRDIPNNVVIAGVPAKVIKENK